MTQLADLALYLLEGPFERRDDLGVADPIRTKVD
jgi:hypothetical protein